MLTKILFKFQQIYLECNAISYGMVNKECIKKLENVFSNSQIYIEYNQFLYEFDSVKTNIVLDEKKKNIFYRLD